jgi:hypothetical protein
VYQHWDPLRVCIVGRSYPPEYYSWITVPHVRRLFEKIAIETEEDYQRIIDTLRSFGVEILRPDLPTKIRIGGKFLPPPMTPRDHMVMIGDTFYKGYQLDVLAFYNNVKDQTWPSIDTADQFWNLPNKILAECQNIHGLDDYMAFYSSYDRIFDRISSQGNCIKDPLGDFSNGAYVSRIGKDLYFGTTRYDQDLDHYRNILTKEFPDHRTHIINTGGHGDGTYCPVCPGLIISLNDVPSYRDTFPGWEVVYLPNQSWNLVRPFLDLKTRNQGRWWIPGWEYDQNVISVVETWLSDWVGYVEETVFDVNMLIIDQKNVIVFNHNQSVFDAFERYGITPHVVPFRHRFFWDGGIHCVTTDLDRLGIMQDFFPERRDESRHRS